MELKDLPFESYDKRKDDAVFLESLLKEHRNIIDSKNDIDKILFSMEISRLLGRVALHERVNSEKEKRPIDSKKYDSYHKTALYVARRGIDIGVSIAYDRHDKGDDTPEFGYDNAMGWLYVQYSMMMLESKRYFAAMDSIGKAETHLRSDTISLITDKNVKKYVKVLKKMPNTDGKSLNYSAKQLTFAVKATIQVKIDELMDAIDEKKIRILYKIYNEVPSDYHDMYAGQIINLLNGIVQNRNTEVINRLSEIYHVIKGEYPEPPKDYLTIQDLSIRGDIWPLTDSEKQYSYWANANHLVLSYLDFVPDLIVRSLFCCDDLVLKSQDDELNLIFEDVMETFARCRFQLYLAMAYEDPNTLVAYSLNPKSKRINNHEVLLDMYPRLYSILDKVSHIIIKNFKIELKPRRGSNRLPNPSYSLMVSNISSIDNPYLKVMHEIYNEINPRNARREYGGELPFYEMLPEAEHMDKVRHHIIHSGVCLTEGDSGKALNNDVLYISEHDFTRHCISLITLVKEVIMNTAMAIEYQKKHNPK